MSDVAERVASGVAWLDANEPDWAERIDLSEFNIRDGCYCVLGQVYGNYWDAPLIVKEDEFGVGDETQTRALGFSAAVGHGFKEFDELQDEWIQIIQERQS